MLFVSGCFCFVFFFFFQAEDGIRDKLVTGVQTCALPISPASKEAGEPDHAGNPGGHSVWYGWTATNATPATFETTGSSFDTLLAIYTGASVGALTEVASNNDIFGTNRWSRAKFTPVAGTTY